MGIYLNFANRFGIIVAVCATLTACSNGNSSDKLACTMEARSSVDLTVLDTLGLPLQSYDVSFQVDAGATQKINCNTSDSCPIEYEKSGVFSITVSKPGFNSASREVTVSKDACHVITQRVTFTLSTF